MKLRRDITAMLLASALLACHLTSIGQSFSVSAWKTASKGERRYMAPDFLRRYQTEGMTVAQIKELLGDPDYEHDVWSYNLSVNGPPPPGPQSINLFQQYPQFYVHFKEGRVEKLEVTYGLVLHEDLAFESQLWKSGKPADRLKMSADLIKGKSLEGLAKDAVRELLGSADIESENHEIEYDLGFRELDMVTLTFFLNKNERVIRSQIIEH